MMIDTHAHLDGEEFADDLHEVIQRAKDAKVEKILIPNINLQGLRHLNEVCDTYKDYLLPMIGLHPEEVNENYQNQLDELANIFEEDPTRYKAIGEVGLDFYWDQTRKKEQIDALEQQICWAVKHKKPLMIHSRNAHHELVHVLEGHRNDNLQGVFHCFSGSEEEAKQLLSFEGFMLGIGGIVTFKKSKLPEVLKETVPLNRIVLETDAPYLAPVPHRGSRNESAFLIDTMVCLSAIYQCKIENIAAETNKNANFLL